MSRAVKESNGLEVPAGQGVPPANVPEDIEANSLAPGFNQWMAHFLAPVWDLATSDRVLSFEPDPAVSARNLLGQMDSVSWRERLALRWNRLISRVFPRDPFPVLTLANADAAFRRRNFFLRADLERVHDHWPWPQVEMAPNLRRTAFAKVAESEEANDLFRICGIGPECTDRARSLLLEFLGDFFPVQFFEGALQNHEIATGLLRKFRTRALISSGDGNAHSVFVIGAARSLGFKIVKFQHGGHYGYYRDCTPLIEAEYPDTDIFLSWGWTRLPDHPEAKTLQVIPLPGPWLSERRLYWKKYEVRSDRPFGILWMPQMMKRFPGAPQGASSMRRDVLQSFSAEMLEIVKQASARRIRIHCKPYNALTLQLMRETYARLKEVGGHFFERAENCDKGLTMETVNLASLVLWDQPGTGFLECLQCRIPTMVHWSRLYCEEEEWCVPDFRTLEEAGIVHRTASSLFEEYERFAHDPRGWMNRNSGTVARFAKKYAHAMDNWWSPWSRFLKELRRGTT